MPSGVYVRSLKTIEKLSKISEITKNSKGKHWKWSEDAKLKFYPFRKKMIGKENPFYGKRHSEDTKNKMRLAKEKKPTKYWFGKHRSLDTKRKLSNAMKEKLKNPDFAKKIAQNFLNGKPKLFDTKPEIIMYEALLKECYLVIKQHYVKDVGFCDFCLPEHNIIIEVDGNYWHNLPKQKKKDEYRNNKLKELGYKVIRFWEDEIYNDMDKCIKTIKENKHG